MKNWKYLFLILIKFFEPSPLLICFSVCQYFSKYVFKSE